MNRPSLRHAGPGLWQSPFKDLTFRRAERPPGPRGGQRTAWTIDGQDGEWPTLTAAAAARRSQIEGTVYLIHLERRFKHAGHYLGWTHSPASLAARLGDHRSGQGANLLKFVNQAGIAYNIVRTWAGDRNLERRLKRQGSLCRLCPVCADEIRLRRNATQRARWKAGREAA